MFFKKDPMQLGAYIRSLCIEIIQMKVLNYNDYLKDDPEKVLIESKFNIYKNKILELRLFLLTTKLFEILFLKKIKFDSVEFGKIMSNAYVIALEKDNEFSNEATNKLIENNLLKMDQYSNFFEEHISRKDFFNKSCVFESLELFKIVTPKDTKEEGTYVALINQQRKIIKYLVDNSFKKIKIIYPDEYI
jgi:hypothetical protein